MSVAQVMQANPFKIRGSSDPGEFVAYAAWVDGFPQFVCEHVATIVPCASKLDLFDQLYPRICQRKSATSVEKDTERRLRRVLVGSITSLCPLMRCSPAIT